MMLIILGIVLIVLILLVCGDRGSKSILSTVIHCGVLLLSISLLYRGLNPLLVTFAACTLITCITMFYQNEADVKSKAAFISVIAVIIVLIPFVYYLATGSNAEGFNAEQYEITDSNGYTRNIGISMLYLQMCVMIIALIGTVIDISIAITTSIYEIRSNGTQLTLKELTAAAFVSSRSILNTSIHTIFYIYIAEYLTLMIQYVDEYSLVRLINSESFCSEFISVTVSGIGCCLIVPVAAVTGAVMIDKFFKKKEEAEKAVEEKTI